MWGAYFAYTRSGIGDGLLPQDIVFIRFAVAGAVLFPWIALKGLGTLARVGWWRGLALALAIGPFFILAASAGFLFTPLSHGAVLQPSTAALTSILVAGLYLREPISWHRLTGAAVIIAGIVLIASGMGGTAGPDAWIGDMLFVFAGLCWATFTILIRLWNIGGLAATAAASVVSAMVVIPAFFIFSGVERLLALPPSILFTQILVQGLLAGVAAIVAYGRAVSHLGASGAALFPALVPAATLLIGIPVTGEFPGMIEWTGAILATIGLSIAMCVLKGFR